MCIDVEEDLSFLAKMPFRLLRDERSEVSSVSGPLPLTQIVLCCMYTATN